MLNPFQNITYLLGWFFFSDSSKNFERLYLKNWKSKNWFFIRFTTLCNFFDKKKSALFEGRRGLHIFNEEKPTEGSPETLQTITALSYWRGTSIWPPLYRVALASRTANVSFSSMKFYVNSTCHFSPLSRNKGRLGFIIQRGNDSTNQIKVWKLPITVAWKLGPFKL